MVERRKGADLDMIPYILEQFQRLAAIPSPTGYTQKATDYVVETLRGMGFAPQVTRKGCTVVDLGGQGEPLVLAAHVDTIGAMVAEVKANGHLRISRIGGLVASSVDGENCTVFPRFKEDGITGCCQIMNPSTHVNTNLSTTLRDFDNLEIVLDEKVKTAADVYALGIHAGDFVSFEPRTVITPAGYIKSRHIDDKMGLAILLALAKEIAEGGINPHRKVYLFISSYEEVGHGACAGIPLDAADIIAVDMGCVGDGLTGTETQVCICAKDLVGPSDYALTTELIRCAQENGIGYAVDVYPSYSTDADAALRAGRDLRHAVMGMGVYASHGYERTHVDGVRDTFDLLSAYIS